MTRWAGDGDAGELLKIDLDELAGTLALEADDLGPRLTLTKA